MERGRAGQAEDRGAPAAPRERRVGAGGEKPRISVTCGPAGCAGKDMKIPVAFDPARIVAWRRVG